MDTLTFWALKSSTSPVLVNRVPSSDSVIVRVTRAIEANVPIRIEAEELEHRRISMVLDVPPRPDTRPAHDVGGGLRHRSVVNVQVQGANPPDDVAGVAGSHRDAHV